MRVGNPREYLMSCCGSEGPAKRDHRHLTKVEFSHPLLTKVEFSHSGTKEPSALSHVVYNNVGRRAHGTGAYCCGAR